MKKSLPASTLQLIKDLMNEATESQMDEVLNLLQFQSKKIVELEEKVEKLEGEKETQDEKKKKKKAPKKSSGFPSFRSKK